MKWNLNVSFVCVRVVQVISIKDNDSLAARLAAEVQADLLILMSDVDGIYTCPPSEEGARLIHTYSPEHAVTIQYGKKSRVGLGGMDSKVTHSILYVSCSGSVLKVLAVWGGGAI